MFEWNGRKNALNLFSETAQVFDTKYIKAKIHGQFKLLDFLQYFKNVTFRLLHMRRMITLAPLQAPRKVDGSDIPRALN